MADLIADLCQVKTFKDYGYVGCHRNAKVERAGRRYCGLHDPSRVAARKAKLDEKRAARRKALDDRYNAGADLVRRLGAGQPYDGGVWLSRDEAEALLARLKETR